MKVCDRCRKEIHNLSLVQLGIWLGKDNHLNLVGDFCLDCLEMLKKDTYQMFLKFKEEGKEYGES